MAAGSTQKERRRSSPTAGTPAVSAMTTKTTSTCHTALASAVVPRKQTRSYKSDSWTRHRCAPGRFHVSPKIGLSTVRYRSIIGRPKTRFHVEYNAETRPAFLQLVLRRLARQDPSSNSVGGGASSNFLVSLNTCHTKYIFLYIISFLKFFSSLTYCSLFSLFFLNPHLFP